MDEIDLNNWEENIKHKAYYIPLLPQNLIKVPPYLEL